MLTEKQYEAIGRLALAFNEVEYAIDSWCALFVSAPERTVSRALCHDKTSFDLKLQRFKRIMRAIVEERPALKSRIEAIDKVLTRAKQLSEKRNEYVHALVVTDFRTMETKIRVKETEIECDHRAIYQLAIETRVLATQLVAEFAEFVVTLEQARKSK